VHELLLWVLECVLGGGGREEEGKEEEKRK